MSFNIEHLKQRPHLVILGAGATIATIPAGDKYGRKSSVMDNFISELQLNDLFKNIQLKTNSKNLENIYSELYERNDCQNIRLALEERIFNHFDLLCLPDQPTIYDLLIISLRKKDAIATFNWDPLLLQAYNRLSCLQIPACTHPCKNKSSGKSSVIFTLSGKTKRLHF